MARRLVVFLRRPGNQAQFSAQLAAQTAQRDPLREVQHWITEHPDADLSVDALAARARLSPRHFARAFRAETGITPGRYVDGSRLERPAACWRTPADGVAEIARAGGYGTPEAMRRAFVGTLGTAPAEYRRRFHSASPAERPACRSPSCSSTASPRSTPSAPTRSSARIPGAEVVFVAEQAGPVRTDTASLALDRRPDARPR